MSVQKCEECGKEIQFPFTCNYCHGAFCPEHRIPENHHCVSLPKNPIFWYERKKSAEEQELRDAMHGHEVCPKCHSPDVGVWSFDKEKASYQCNICGHKWIEQLNKTGKPDSLKEEPKEEPKKPKKKHWFF